MTTVSQLKQETALLPKLMSGQAIRIVKYTLHLMKTIYLLIS